MLTDEKRTQELIKAENKEIKHWVEWKVNYLQCVIFKNYI